ncbi:MAG: RtcB family protein [Bacillota bacterium]|nr:RtcB family protein [Bacillota bacterium]
MELVSLGKNRYKLPRQGKMRVEGIVYVNKNLYEHLFRDNSLKQLAQAASLPGVVRSVFGMPDIHQGFGLPIGGVMATAVPDGVISAGAVGMDINCGVRLLRTNLSIEMVNQELLYTLIKKIEVYVPTGVGKKSRRGSFNKEFFKKVLHLGVPFLVQNDYGWPEDALYVEENGCLPGAEINAVSREALRRGSEQLGTLGGGNHFIEIQVVDTIYEPRIASFFGIENDQILVMIHTGSRGFGHQICTDYTKILYRVAKEYGIEVPERGLACTPINSPEGQAYYAAMACAVNFAFCNRQLITHDIRQAFQCVFQKTPEELEMKIIYDVAHNIAKFEEHSEGKLLIHRKGATRALPPGHFANPEVYQKTGHPVLVPGSMGTASYVLVGTPKAAEPFYSVNHGAGRLLSRTAAEKGISGENFKASMQGIVFDERAYHLLLDEAPAAYKNIDDVVETLAEIDFVLKVARLRPLAVIKGKD